MRLKNRVDLLEKKFSSFTSLEDHELLSREELFDFLTFQRYWFKIRTGVEFRISNPISRKSHHIILAELARDIFEQKVNRAMVNIAPRYGKTEFCCAILLYSFAYFPISKWMYLSIDKNLVRKAVDIVENVMRTPQWNKIYETKIVKRRSDQTSVQIENNFGGEIYGVSAWGGIAGHGAAVQNMNGFSGGAIIDDIHKLSTVTSITERDNASKIYSGSIFNRLNDKEKGLILCVGQIAHEDDLFMRLRSGKHDIYPYHILKLKALDEHDNALYPELESAENLKKLREKEPYFFSSQHQQEPIPAGGSLFKEEYLVYHPPSIFDKILITWLTIDGAETNKTWNDPTVMTFFGMYKIDNSDEYGLHIIDCLEEHVDAGDLENTFNRFYAHCCQFKVKPRLVGIEKKSAGVTLLSVLKKRQALNVVDTIPFRLKKELSIYDKSKRESSKLNRFISCQKYWNSRYISVTEATDCAQKIKEHMGKITANGSHRHDDIADTIADAIFMVYITHYIPSLIKDKAAAQSTQNMQLQKKGTGIAKWRR